MWCDLLFSDDDDLSKVILCQKANLTCASPIEKGYYQNHERTLKLKPIYIHCGGGGTVGTFILGQDELRAKGLTEVASASPSVWTAILLGRRL